MDELLEILKKNALETPDNLSKMLGIPVEEVRERIAGYEQQGIIRGYQAIVDEDQLEMQRVTAAIEVKVTPQREGGFDHVAKRISRFPEVESMFLMSGGYDLLLFVSGHDLRQVAGFVSEKLSTIDGVTGTATHFMLKTYKHKGVLMETPDEYERLKISP